MEAKCEYLMSIDSVAQVTKVDLIQELLAYNK